MFWPWTPENWDMTRAFLSLDFQKRDNGNGIAFFVSSIMLNFIVYQDRLETNLLQLFGHLENSELFSIISVIIFEVNIVDEQKQT